jgi:PKD repeat protein
MSKILVTLALIVLLVSFTAGCGKSGPQADFTAAPETGYPPLEVQFTDSSTGEIEVWEWDFDSDGIIDSTEQNPQYTYDAPGNYTIILTVSSPNGNNTIIQTGFIKVVPCPRFADFTAEPTVGVGVTTVQFTDMSTSEVLSWAWDFESDGLIDSNEQNPSHVYTRNGVYSVTLTITTPTCDDTITKYDYISITGCKT